MAMVMPAASSASQAVFWRRVWALAIDLAAVQAIVAAAALLLFQATDGFIRIGELPAFGQSVCRSFTTERPRDKGSEKITTTMCEHALLGLAHDRRLDVREEQTTGALTSTHTVTHAVDANGQPMRALYLDQVLVLVLMAYFGVAEWRFGTTLGKRLVGLRIRTADGRPLRFGNACKRLVRFAPLIPLTVGGLVAAAVDPAAALAQPAAFWIGALSLYALTAAMWVAVQTNFAIAAVNDDLPWHDRWAGTDVVRR